MVRTVYNFVLYNFTRKCISPLTSSLTRQSSLSSSSTERSAGQLPKLSGGPIDALRAGGTVGFKYTALGEHPMEAVQNVGLANEWETSLRLTAMAHGQAAAMEKRIDRAALSQIQRLPGGPPSSHVLLDSWLGRDSSIGFEDVLNCACEE